jgi:hypothetical protein
MRTFFLQLSLLLFIFSSCTSTKKVVTTKDVQVVKTDPKPEPSRSDVEIIDFKDVTPTSKPPIKNDDKIGTSSSGTHSKDSKDNISKPKNYDIPEMLDQVFDIVMAFPFSDPDPSRFLKYYSGSKIAAKQLEGEGAKLNITLIDSSEPDYLNKIDKNVDLIFASNSEKQIKELAELGNQINVPVLSSFFSLSSIVSNPYYIQTRPSLKSHFAAMINDIAVSYKSSDIVIVGRQGKNDDNWFEPFQSEARSRFGIIEGKPLKEILLNETNISFASELASNKKVFIFPNYSFKDEDFIQSALKKLNLEKGNKIITVYAMALVKDSDKISKELYESLKIKIPTSKYLDRSTPEAKEFANNYFLSFSDLPDQDAFEGADNMLFIGRALARYGRGFMNNFDREQADYLQSSFDMKPVSKTNNGTDYFENYHIKILSFDGIKWTP